MPYRLRRKDGETVQCDSCNYPAPVDEFESFPLSQRPRLLCEFCSTSMASRITERRATTDAARLEREVWIAAANVANFLASRKAKS